MITINEKECLRCGRRWLPRKPGRPKVCAKCRSPYWDKPYKSEATKARALKQKATKVAKKEKEV